jgi:hypothetical protein
MTTWRKTQLGNDLCDQDRIILDLVKDRSVQIHGDHYDFAQHLCLDQNSDFLIILFTRSLWLSEVHQTINDNLAKHINNLYIGINRYVVLGNDTNMIYNDSNIGRGQQILDVIKTFIASHGFSVRRQGSMDHDQGRYFNFVQPLTWLYAERETNTSH